MKISTITNNYKIYSQTSNALAKKYSNQVSFGSNPINYLKGLFFKENFIPEDSILENEDGYIGEVGMHIRHLPINEKQKEVKRLYSILETKEEKELFKQHFGRYLVDDKQKQTAQPRHQRNTWQTSQTSKQGTPYTITQCEQSITKPVTQRATTKEVNVVKPEAKTITKETLFEEFEKLEKDDIPAFVAKIANGTREEQYALLEIKDESAKRHKELIDNDPLTLFRKKINNDEELKQKLNSEIEERFRQQGRKYNSTDIVKKRIEALRQMEIDAGFVDYDPKTVLLGQKRRILEKQMEKQNISFVSKVPEKFNSDDEKWSYIRKSLNQAQKNLASAMDALTVFEKYGAKVYTSEPYFDSLSEFNTAILLAIEAMADNNSRNTIISKYIKVISKFVSNDQPNKRYSSDAAALLPYYNALRTYMNRDNIVDFIKLFGDISIDKQQYKDIKFYTDENTWQMYYKNISREDMTVIQQAVEELGKKVENLPDNYLNP